MHAPEAILLPGGWFDAGGTLVNILVALLFGRIGQWHKSSIQHK